MADVAPADILAFVLRLVFLALLYVTVGAMLLALRRSLSAEPSALGRRTARLVLKEAPPADGPLGRAVTLTGDTTIGRRAVCDVVVQDDSVSGRHARLRRRAGGWEVEDLGSTNGTFVNGTRIESRTRLQPGDVIAVGLSRWQLEIEP